MPTKKLSPEAQAKKDIIEKWFNDKNLSKLQHAYDEIKSQDSFTLTEEDHVLSNLIDDYAWQIERHYMQLIYNFVKDTQWNGKDCQLLHHQLVHLSQAYRNTLDKNGKPILEELANKVDLDDTIEGYASDDSDTEFVPDKITSDMDRGQITRVRRKNKNRRWKHLQQVRKGVLTDKKLPTTYRQYDLDPDPSEIVQLVNRVRELHMGKKSEKFDEFKELAEIRHPKDTWTKQVEKDFVAAQALFRKKDIQGLAQLKTKFAIAQYRGITYNNEIFDKKARQFSRNRDEMGDSIYSMSVVDAAGVPLNDYFRGELTREQDDALTKVAKQLKQTLIEKRNSDPITVNGFKYDNMAEAIQNLYTIDYKYFFSTLSAFIDNETLWKQHGYKPEINESEVNSTRSLSKFKVLSENAPELKKIDESKIVARYPKRKEVVVMTYEGLVPYNKKEHGDYLSYLENVLNPKLEEIEKDCVRQRRDLLKKKYQSLYGVVPPSDWRLFDGLLNGKCPFVSMGDAPRTALKYGFGMKYYNGNEHKRLLPSWNSKGRCARPYSGKVFGTLHTLTEFIEDAPLHVPSLAAAGKIKVDNMVLTELENTFPAYVPGERVALEYVCKFPSFNGPWRARVHMKKYGLTPSHYKELAKAVLSDNVQKEGFYRPLSAWLVNFHETRIVELMRREALSKGLILVTQDKNGQLSRTVDYFLLSRKDQSSYLTFSGKEVEQKFTFDSIDDRIDGDVAKDDQTGLIKSRESIKRKPQYVYKTFPQTVQEQGYTVSNDVPGDGNCFFTALHRAMLHNLDSNQTGSLFINENNFRYNLVGLYNTHTDIRDNQRVTPEYIHQMSRPAAYSGQVSRWGSDAEIILFCRAFNIKVTVFSPTYPNGQSTFGSSLNNPVTTLYLVNARGNHWEYATPNN